MPMRVPIATTDIAFASANYIIYARGMLRVKAVSLLTMPHHIFPRSSERHTYNGWHYQHVVTYTLHASLQEEYISLIERWAYSLVPFYCNRLVVNSSIWYSNLLAATSIISPGFLVTSPQNSLSTDWFLSTQRAVYIDFTLSLLGLIYYFGWLFVTCFILPQLHWIYMYGILLPLYCWLHKKAAGHWLPHDTSVNFADMVISRLLHYYILRTFFVSRHARIPPIAVILVIHYYGLEGSSKVS